MKNVNDTPIVKRETPRFEDGRPLVLQISLNDTAKTLIQGGMSDVEVWIPVTA